MNRKHHPIRARYFGYTQGTENHGDEALMWIIRELLAPEIEVVFGGEDFEAALLGGGTLINQSPWLLDVFEPAIQKVGHGIVFGTGVGNPTFWGNHFDRWVPLLERCAFSRVRGPRSAALLLDNNYQHAKWAGDPYLAIHPPFVRTPTPYLLGVNLGTTNDSQWGGNEQEYLDFMVECLTRLKARGWSFLWLSVWTKDLPIIREVRDRVGDQTGRVLDAREEGLEALACLSGCEVFLGEKLHACAMAAVAEVPFVAFEYQPKVRDFAESVDMGDWMYTTGMRDVGALVRRVDSLQIMHEPAQRRLKTAVEKCRTSIHSFAEEIRNYYSSTFTR